MRNLLSFFFTSFFFPLRNLGGEENNAKITTTKPHTKQREKNEHKKATKNCVMNTIAITITIEDFTKHQQQ